MTTTLSKTPTLPAAPARLPWAAPLLITVEVCTATCRAVLIRLPGGTRTTWVPLSHAREVDRPRGCPEDLRRFQVPKWLHERIRAELTEPAED